MRSEEHTSELQSLRHLVCRLLLEKKKTDDGSARAPYSRPPAAPTNTNTAPLSLHDALPISTRWHDPPAFFALGNCLPFFLRIRRPPRSTLFPYSTLSV